MLYFGIKSLVSLVPALSLASHSDSKAVDSVPAMLGEKIRKWQNARVIGKLELGRNCCRFPYFSYFLISDFFFLFSNFLHVFSPLS